MLLPNFQFIDPLDVSPPRWGSADERLENRRVARENARMERVNLSTGGEVLQRTVVNPRDEDIDVQFYGEDTIVTSTRGRDWLPQAPRPEKELYEAPSDFTIVID